MMGAFGFDAPGESPLGVTQLKSLPHPQPLSIAWRGESAATLPPRYEVERGIEGVRFLCAHLELRNI